MKVLSLYLYNVKRMEGGQLFGPSVYAPRTTETLTHLTVFPYFSFLQKAKIDSPSGVRLWSTTPVTVRLVSRLASAILRI